jgi:regulator of protease activity HflC (stomatin/prohibitin superfamily)
MIAELLGAGFLWLLVVLVLFFLSAIKIVNEYERGVKFTLGRYVGLMGPGINFVFPIFQSWERVDIRTTVIPVPQQDIITKDNVSIVIDAVIYFRVSKADLAILEVRNYRYAISQLAQTTMRDVIGAATLDEVLSKRESNSEKIKTAVDRMTENWGVTVDNVELKEIILPESLVRVISQEAEAERAKRAVLIRAEGELESAKNIAQAAKELTAVKGGVHLRTLQVIQQLSTEKSLTMVHAIPSELLKEINIKLLDLFKGK